MDKDLVTLTNEFVEYIKPLLHKEAQEGMDDPHFLLAPQGGGCNGFQYIKEIKSPEAIKEEFGEYSLIKHQGVKVAIPKLGEYFLSGCILEYDRFDGIKIQNPNAASSCGCGKSFGV